MTPTLAEIILGQVAAMAAPAPPEASGDYLAGRMAMIGMLAGLAAQEAERGVAARVWENAALCTLFERAAREYDEGLEGRLRLAADRPVADLSWSGLDARNADLRRLLIALHEEVELRGDAPFDREILDLYRSMAHQRRLDLPAGLG
ncbi:MAG TPA: hypothetical protein VII63_07940 [Caulobacteraceae bacterium]